MQCQCLNLFSGTIFEEGRAGLGQIEIIPQARNFEMPRLGSHFAWGTSIDTYIKASILFSEFTSF